MQGRGSGGPGGQKFPLPATPPRFVCPPHHLQQYYKVIDRKTLLSYIVSVHLLGNFNSPNHGSNVQHLKHQAKTNLIKSVVTGQPTKLLRRRSN